MNLYVRKGSVIGVYFRTTDTPMPVVGSLPSGGHQVCKYQGTISTNLINCTSSFVPNLIVHAEVQISKYVQSTKCFLYAS